jgi:hypothetical protein
MQKLIELHQLTSCQKAARSANDRVKVASYRFTLSSSTNEYAK